MFRFLIPAVLAAVIPTGCVQLEAYDAEVATGADCVALFRQYDVVDATMSTPRRERWAVPPELERLTDRLRRADCITLTRDLTGLDDVPLEQVGDSGAAIDPIALHVGVVTNSADDARSIEYFEARGLWARSVGKPGLGRRVYVGPVASAGALEAAAELAREAGFAHPYPARF